MKKIIELQNRHKGLTWLITLFTIPLQFFSGAGIYIRVFAKGFSRQLSEVNDFTSSTSEVVLAFVLVLMAFILSSLWNFALVKNVVESLRGYKKPN